MRPRPYFPYTKQPNEYTCGPACLKMLAEFYRQNTSIKKLQKVCNTDKEYGTQFRGIQRGLKHLDLKRLRVKKLWQAYSYLNYGVPILVSIPDPGIPEEDHYVLIIGTYINKHDEMMLYVNDPWYGENVWNAEMFWKQVEKRGPWAWAIVQRGGAYIDWQF